MRRLLAAVLIFTSLSQSIGHADTDDRLLAALQVLQTRVTLTTEADRAIAASREVPLAALALTTALALSTRIPGVPWQRLGLPARTIITKSGEASVYALGLGGAMFAGAKMFSFIDRARGHRRPLDYTTAAGLRRFFESPVDEQFMIARRDPPFTMFLIHLGESFVTLDQGFAAPPPRPLPDLDPNAL